MEDGRPLSETEQRLWNDIVKDLGEFAGLGGLLGKPVDERAQELWGGAAAALRGSQAPLSPDETVSSQSAESSPGDHRRKVVLALAAMLAATSVLGAWRLIRAGEEDMQPVALLEMPDAEQLEAKRIMLGDAILLIRTGTCAEELEAAADGAWGSEPSRDELLAGAALARQVKALCFPEANTGSNYIVRIENGTIVAVNGETLPGERNSAEALCGPDGLASLNERSAALPPGSAERQHVDALRIVVEENC